MAQLKKFGNSSGSMCWGVCVGGQPARASKKGDDAFEKCQHENVQFFVVKKIRWPPDPATPQGVSGPNTKF